MAVSSVNELLHDDGRPSFTVGQFVDVLNQVMKQAFDGGVWVEGEIEGLKQTGPNMYFTLVEQTPKGKMTLNINLFRNDLSRVTRKLSEQGLQLKNGLKVKLQGSPDYYGPFGKLSLIARDVDTTFTLGDLALKREELLRKLRETGVMEKNKRRPLPLVPLRLGVISSAEAAGWADARQHLSESGIAFNVSFCAVRVQGDQAVPMVVQALDYFSQRVDIDVVLLMRGGGSKSDLAAFDEEHIALAIARCKHPVFTGIGHQIDRSIADEVAHTACKTPTACADAVIEHVSSFLVDLQDTAASIASSTRTALHRSRTRLTLSTERLRTLPVNSLERQRQRIMLANQKVQLLDPVATLARGWSITRDLRGHVIRDLTSVSRGEEIVTTVHGGTVRSTITEVEQ